MTGFKGSEKRKFPRINANFVVSYKQKKASDSYDLSQTRNVSQGGMLVTTNRKFEKGVLLAVTIRFPFVSQRIELEGKVVSSREVVKNLIYETRILFLEKDVELFKSLGEFIEKQLQND